MKILLELPTWLGDAVMATPAIESLLQTYPQARLTLFGSPVALRALEAHPAVDRSVEDRSREGGLRPLNIYRSAKELGPHDLALSFRSSVYSTLLLHFSGSGRIGRYPKKLLRSRRQSPVHQVRRYQDFVDAITGIRHEPGPLRLYWPRRNYPRPSIGINPGAAYGSAKRWYPEGFAAVAEAFASTHDIVIFGGPGELRTAEEIESRLKERGIDGLINLAGKTSVPELCSAIAGLDLFVTNDSGPQHIAAAYGIPTVAVFGPTRHLETSPWMNPRSVVVRRDLECAPCMKRECPLKHHACMKEIEAAEVIEAARTLLRTPLQERR